MKYVSDNEGSLNTTNNEIILVYKSVYSFGWVGIF